MLLPIVSSRKLISRLVLEKEEPFVDFIKSFREHEFAECHPEIRVYTCQYKADKFCGHIYKKLTFDEPHHIQQAVFKRRAEFLAGRIAAMVALEALDSREVRVATGTRRNPIWPRGYLGSISHTSERAMAVVAPEGSATYVGIDHEEIMSTNLATKIAPQILTSQEMQIYYQLNMGFEQFCTIVFSVKESVFKAIYPKVDMYVNFNAARVTEICTESQSFSVELCSTLLPGELEAGKVFKGYLLIDYLSVSTLVCTD